MNGLALAAVVAVVVVIAVANWAEKANGRPLSLREFAAWIGNPE